ncbi:MAG: glutamine synthetase [Deltaproteobacteria bacterium]|nr:glutamine synthetase [Deltaproteobacteria bacterium]
MFPEEVRSIEDAKEIVAERDLSHVKVGVFDLDGVFRGKYMSRDKFISSLDSGFGFCDVVLGWDSDDQLYDNVKYTGWHTGYPDAPVRILPETCRELPMEGEGNLIFLAEFTGKAEAVCPRGVLRRVLENARDKGLLFKAACEYEFFMFKEDPNSIREKGYQNLKPITPGNFGYSVLRNSVWSDFYLDLMEMSNAMDFPIEGLHTETGPGVIEAALAVDDALAAADKANLFKTFTKVIAQKQELMATFMAKWSNDVPGQSGHIHVSMFDEDGNSAFYDDTAEYNMSAAMRSFVAGQKKYMPEVLSMIAPTVNSFSRLVPGFWAPTSSMWSVDNRTTALRVIPGSAKSQRVEHRVGAADGNPYIVLAAVIASGLKGLDEGLELGPAITGNGYDVKPTDEECFPATLFEAAQRLRQSEMAIEYFGKDFVEHFASTREWEERESRRHISDWELKRYFEII